MDIPPHQRNQGKSWRLRAGASVLLAGAFGISLVDCGSAPAGGARVAGPPWLGKPVGSQCPPHAASVNGPCVAPPGETLDPTAAGIADPAAAVFDPKSVKQLLDDPRLAEVKALVARDAHLGAANKLGEIMQKAQLDGIDEARWEYQLGHLRLLGGDPLAAVRAFDRAAAFEWPLAGYARLVAADLLIKSDQPGEGLARLAAIPPGDALDDEIALVKAAGHAASHDIDEASAIWDAYLARRPRPAGWHTVALRFVKALLNQPSVDRAEKAVTVARQVIVEAPNGRAVAEARQLEEQALGTLPSAKRNALLSLADLAQRAHGLAVARQGRDALAQADKVIEQMEKESSGGGLAATCQPYIARGKALEQLKRVSEASDAFGVAIQRCPDGDDKAAALLAGCRTALKSGQPSTARHRCATLEKDFPSHSFADDARLFGAEAAKSQGDVAAFTRMLLAIGDDYPSGDKVDEALFTLAFDRIDAGDWAAAVAPLERAVAIKPRGRPYWAEGRPQYYLARAKLETGAASEGQELLERVIRDFPLSYYMVHAYARLASLDPGRAERAVKEAMAAEPEGEFVIADHGELHQPGFLRAVELTRQGDSARALAELERVGVRDKSAHPSLVWAAAFLLSQIDAPAESHGVLRSSGLWTEHYPAGIWRHVWEVAYPRPFQAIVAKELARSPIPEHLAFAVMREESAFKPHVVSHANAYGLMQLILPTAKSVAGGLKVKATKETLKKPEINIALGCRFLFRLQQRFDFNPVLAIPGYNAGPGAPKKWLGERPAEPFDVWIEKIPYTETREYTKRVIQSMAAYAMLYGHGMDAALMTLPLETQPPDAQLDAQPLDAELESEAVD